MDLEEILGQVGKAGCKSIDIWPMVHGNQREQLEEMGAEQFALLLKKHELKLGCITQFKLVRLTYKMKSNFVLGWAAS